MIPSTASAVGTEVRYSTHPDDARQADACDPLGSLRDAFELPRSPADPNRTAIYLCGNSLGPMPRDARRLVGDELDAWARLGTEGYGKSPRAWFEFTHEARPALARLAGASAADVMPMNSLTVNIHLMLASFYRPTRDRNIVIIEDTAFPSDSYAVQSHVARMGCDPRATVVRLRPRSGERCLRTEDVEDELHRRGDSVALLFLGSLNYLTGQVMDVERLTAAAHARGAKVGWDLAHAIGNVLTPLAKSNADFAVWCSYKYLNGGPGAVGGAYVNPRWSGERGVPRLAGWWGNNPATRMQMHPDFDPAPGIDGFALSNVPVLTTAPLFASLALFERAGFEALRARSRELTGYLEFLIDSLALPGVSIVTPRDPLRRGCQLSIAVSGDGRATLASLRASDVIGDFREPDIIRLAPAPLFTSRHEVWRAAAALGAHYGVRLK
ncbi:MAG: kynureninase [Phycisphaerae bacterium]|nr:kynureninase [Phycisphaerae bacterium]